AFVIGAVIILATGNDPLAAYGALFNGAFGSQAALGRTLVNTTPLIFTGLAVAVAFRTGLFNIGGEGQFYMGAMAAAWLGVLLGFLGVGAIPAVLIGCAVAGFLYGAIPGFLKAYFGAHEVITTIMLNFIAYFLTAYLTRVPLAREGPIPGTEPIEAAARIPLLGLGLGRANWG
ncbi:MAG: ABC transporter permease, partial [Actinomycetes bacterium]